MGLVTEAKAYSLSELVETDPRYKELRARVSGYEKGSDEYLKQLIDECPLNSYPDYKQFLKKQAVPLEGSEEKGYSAVYRSSLSPDHLFTCFDKRLSTLYEHFLFACKLWPKNDCLGHRRYDPIAEKFEDYYHFQSYEEVEKISRHVGSGIMSLVNTKRGKALNSNDFIVSILSHNNPEWIITDLACQAYSLTNTALYETLGPETSEYIMNLTESPVLVFAKSNLYKVINILPHLKYVNTLVCMEDLDDSELHLINSSLLPMTKNSRGESISVHCLCQVEHIGVLNEIPVIPPTPDSLYTISFTSGTTGTPKGVELTHMHAASGIAFTFSTLKIPNSKKGQQLHDLCFLPLAHIFQRMIVAFGLSMGVGLGFLHIPDPAVLVEDMKILKPDMISLVPRVLTRLEAGIKNSLDKSNLQNNVANNILGAKQARLTAKGGPDRSLVNYLIFHRVLIDKIRDSLGFKKVAFVITGSAPISSDTLLFLRSALDIGMRQGYGLTETFAGFCLSEPYEKDPGSCGAIGVTVECRLKSVPEMGYCAEKDLKGELQVRGPQVFKRYFKRPEETSKAIDENGWFSTGDVAQIDSKGRLRVIDRVKNFFKLAQGEYIAPEKIENLYLSSCPLITQIFVYGDSFKTFLVGIVGIDVDGVKNALSSKHPEMKRISGSKLVECLNTDRGLKKEFLISVNRYIHNLQGFEKLHNIHVAIEPLKVEDDVVTPTLKIKRGKATKHFKILLDELYRDGSIIKKEKL